MNSAIDLRLNLIRKYYKFFIVGLFIRLIFAPWTGHDYDLPIWLDSGKKLATGLSPYTSYIHLGQTVLWAFWTGFSYSISANIFDSNLYINIFFIKLLPIIIDMIIPIELILIVNRFTIKEISMKKKKILFYATWLNPFFILVSSFWAMIDNLAFILIVFSMVLILNKKYTFSIIFNAISISIKLYPIIFLPFICILILWNEKSYIKSGIYGVSVVLVFFFIAYFPFYLFNWNNQVMTGVLSSQLTRSSGGVTPLGIITNLTVGNEFSSLFLALFNLINNAWFLNLIWILNLFLLSIFYLVKYSRYWFNFDHSQNNFERKIFAFAVDMAIIYFIVWYFSAKWISEQNFIPFFGFLLVKILLLPDDSFKIEKYKRFFWQFTFLITLFLVFNASIFVFFYLVYDVYNLIDILSIFPFLRSIGLLMTSIGIILMLMKYLLNKKYSKFFNFLLFNDFLLFGSVISISLLTSIFKIDLILDNIVLISSTMIYLGILGLISLYFWKSKFIQNKV